MFEFNLIPYYYTSLMGCFAIAWDMFACTICLIFFFLYSLFFELGTAFFLCFVFASRIPFSHLWSEIGPFLLHTFRFIVKIRSDNICKTFWEFNLSDIVSTCFLQFLILFKMYYRLLSLLLTSLLFCVYECAPVCPSLWRREETS